MGCVISQAGKLTAMNITGNGQGLRNMQPASNHVQHCHCSSDMYSGFMKTAAAVTTSCKVRFVQSQLLQMVVHHRLNEPFRLAGNAQQLGQ